MYLGSSWNNDQIDSMTEKRRKKFFKDSFYASAATVKEIFRDIQHPDLGAARIEKPNPADLLAAFYFLKKYPTKFDQAKYVGSSERKINAPMNTRGVYNIKEYEDYFHAVCWDRFWETFQKLKQGSFRKPNKKAPNY